MSKVKLPKGTFDGVDVKSAFYGKGVTRTEPVFWSERKSAAILKDNYKGVMLNKKFALYDIVKDPSEQKNLKDSHREIANKMQDDLQQWHKNLHQN